MKQHLESQKSYYIAIKCFSFSSPEVAELSRQYHVTSKTEQKHIANQLNSTACLKIRAHNQFRKTNQATVIATLIRDKSAHRINESTSIYNK